LTLDKTFGDHHVTATAVYEQQGQKFINERLSGNQDNNTIQTSTVPRMLQPIAVAGKSYQIVYWPW